MSSLTFRTTDRRVRGDLEIEFPTTIRTLDDFREWVATAELPESARLEFRRGKVEIDMAAEEIETHVLLKSDLTVQLGMRLRRTGVARLFVDGTLFTNDETGLAREPDLIVCTNESLATGRVRLREIREGSGRRMQLNGSPDLVIEIVSRSSVRKDTIELRDDYFAAGVGEYWIFDGRGDDVVWTMLSRGAGRYEEVPASGDGFRRSPLFGCEFRLRRETDPNGLYIHTLDER
ncbi:MAG TPA: Uma2 family endonuclease [Planctomycetaceae bacterium]